MIKLLLGASPCTYWSIAKREGREVVAAGQGWELFNCKRTIQTRLFLV